MTSNSPLTEAATSAIASFPTRRDKPIEVMSLQEKFIEIRRQIPRISKEKHSDGVTYKFAKIDDVWRVLTPILNELGVNFDITKEENTQLKTMTTQRNGQMFLYESDLTICWTNADNDDDTNEAQTHAIAWNDDPAKAKGSAWTYAIKYYLFEKFSIDMGDTDPDLTPKTGFQSPSQSLQNNRAIQSHQKYDRPGQNGQNEAAKSLTGPQLDRMYRKGKDAGLTQEQISDQIRKDYNKTPEELIRSEYDDICKRLDKKAKEIHELKQQ